MSKHKKVSAEQTINDVEFMATKMLKEEMDEYIKSNLAHGLAESIIENNLGTLTTTQEFESGSTKIRLSFMVMDLGDYMVLRDVIIKNHINVIKDGDVIPLIDLL
jgi:hypothetical protein